MKNIIFLLSIGFLVGCAATPQKPISMDSNFLQTGSKKMGVALTAMPQPDVHLPGASCLLCMAVAEANHSTLSAHVETLKSEDFKMIQDELVKKMSSKGIEVVSINDILNLEILPEHNSEAVGSTARDFRELRNKFNITHLLVVEINAIGINRKYSAYVPTENPNAMVRGASYIVDLSNNTYKWYKPIQVHKSAAGEWDEPPHFPGLTNAYFQAIEEGRAIILDEIKLGT